MHQYQFSGTTLEGDYYQGKAKNVRAGASMPSITQRKHIWSKMVFSVAAGVYPGK